MRKPADLLKNQHNTYKKAMREPADLLNISVMKAD